MFLISLLSHYILPNRIKRQLFGIYNLLNNKFMLKHSNTGCFHKHLGSFLKAFQNTEVCSAVAPIQVFHNCMLFFLCSSFKTVDANNTGTSTGLVTPRSASQTSTTIEYSGKSQLNKQSMFLWKSRSAFDGCFPKLANDANVSISRISNPSFRAACEYRCIVLMCNALKTVCEWDQKQWTDWD